MPQAKTAPAQTAPEVPSLDSLKHGDQMVQEEISAAVDLLKRQRQIQVEIGENRQTLRLLDKRQKLSEQQGEWLDAFYPLKAKGEQRSKEEIAKTKAVRAAALGVSVADVDGDSDGDE